MRLFELMDDPIAVARNLCSSIISSIQSQGKKSIPLTTILNILKQEPELTGLRIDTDFVQKALSGLPDVQVKMDPSTNQLSAWVDTVVPAKVKNTDDKIKAAALRTLDKEGL